MRRDPSIIKAALAAGVQGYVIKPLISTDLIPAVKQVMKGNTQHEPREILDVTHGWRMVGRRSTKMPIVRRFLICAVCVVLMTCSFHLTALEPASLSLSLEPVTHSFKSGGEVRVTAVLRNTSSRDVQLTKIMIAGTNSFEYKVNVWREEDGIQPRKKYVEKLRCNEPGTWSPSLVGSMMFMPIAPAGVRREEIIVSERYDLSAKGRYIVQVERELPEVLGGKIVQSNKVEISITP